MLIQPICCEVRRGTRLFITSVREKVTVWFFCCWRRTPTPTSATKYVLRHSRPTRNPSSSSSPSPVLPPGRRDAARHCDQTEVPQDHQHAKEDRLKDRQIDGQSDRLSQEALVTFCTAYLDENSLWSWSFVIGHFNITLQQIWSAGMFKQKRCGSTFTGRFYCIQFHCSRTSTRNNLYDDSSCTVTHWQIDKASLVFSIALFWTFCNAKLG